MVTWARDVGRGDVLLHRGADERVGCRWVQDKRDGEGFQPVDLKDWTATFSMTLPDGTSVYGLSCTTTSDGYAVAEIPASAFEADTWRARPVGDWRIDATGPGGRRELLGWGHWTLLD